MTYLGKLLVLLNAFAAVAVFAFAASAYVTRVDAVDAVDANGVKLTDKVKKANEAAVAAQGGYPDAVAKVSAAEAALFLQKGRIEARLNEASDDKLFNIYDATGQVTWDSLKGRELKGLDGNPLKGVDIIEKQLADEQTAAAESTATMKKATDTLLALDTEIATLNDRHAWLDVIGKRHAAEIGVLIDSRVNWENRGGSLDRRRNQLIGRLEDLKGKVGAAAPVPPGPAALTAPPPAKPK